MPELPEVETIKEALKKSIEGDKIESVIIRNRQFRELIPMDFEKVVLNASIVKVYRNAKYLILELDNNYSIIWHLGMSGKVKIHESSPESYEKHDHVTIKTNNGYITYNDARRFGLITYCESDKICQHKLFANIGIDPFSQNLTADYLKNKLSNKKNPIKVALLDQSIINGIGNIYASEALYDSKISPLRESNSLNLVELENLITSVRKILQKAIKAGGSTLKDYRKPDGSMGYFQNSHCVYDKEGMRCPNCTCDIDKTKGIKRIVQGGRSTFYCETQQK
ncbi:MAG: bifunctional DNA-formamidopyrimidine glycosylase/DNA-(apurinic or apyrimidinic site) lyase [Alphaproteobacteria bacterium]|nr:bifunctional DNA-formamidopyrimidine glycosylase/DNA-(apurinic or apyrimidinic site) lyase [Alphaproteobacteria bacterium]